MTSRSQVFADSSVRTGGASERRELVLLTGTAIRPDGVGVERRAAQTLKALSTLGRVHVVYSGRGPSRAIVPDSMRPLCSSLRIIRPDFGLDLGRLLRRIYLRRPRWPEPPASLRRLLERGLTLEGLASTRVQLPAPLMCARHAHVFRLAALPLAQPWLEREDAQVSLDLDDLESDTLAAIAQLAAREGDAGLAWTLSALGGAAQRFERAWLPRVARIGVCSEQDRARLVRSQIEAAVTVLPNVFETQPVRTQRRLDPNVIRLLFVGALGYYPNIDALRFTTREVLPRLRARLARRLELHVAGRGMTRALAGELAGVPEVVAHGAVEALDLLYEHSDVALCPVRAGGGTRIKILEAFAHGVPVVATSAGARGLDVTHGRELLLGDDAEDFAEAIAALASRARADALAKCARQFLLVHHDERRFERALCELVGA